MTKSINIIRGESDIQSNAGLALFNSVTSTLPICSDTFLNDGNHRSTWISNGKIIERIIYLQSLGKTDFEDLAELNSNTIRQFLSEGAISPDTARQRLNQICNGDGFFEVLDESNAIILKSARFDFINVNGKLMLPLDIDVTPFINENAHKEGISLTYKKKEGFAPIMAYIGQYALCFELRVGKQHSEKDAVVFLERCISILVRAGIDPDNVLVRVDSAHDDAAFVSACESLGLFFLVKRNFRSNKTKEAAVVFAKKNVSPVICKNASTEEKPRKESKEVTKIYNFVLPGERPTNAQDVNVFSVYQVREPFFDKNGTDPFRLARVTDPTDPGFGRESFIPYEVDSWWTNIFFSPQEGSSPCLTDDASNSLHESVTYQNAYDFVAHVVALYRDHVTHEQYHSELKSDMNMELLPSHYFATNFAYLAISAISFTILRLIGDKVLAVDKSFQKRGERQTKRLRLRTVIEKICRIPAKIVRHARSLTVELGKYCRIAETFCAIYRALRRFCHLA